jgi:signal recognition particle GTPase
VGDVNRLLKQFVQAQRMMKKMARMAGEAKKGGRGRRMFPF